MVRPAPLGRAGDRTVRLRCRPRRRQEPGPGRRMDRVAVKPGPGGPDSSEETRTDLMAAGGEGHEGPLVAQQPPDHLSAGRPERIGREAAGTRGARGRSESGETRVPRASTGAFSLQDGDGEVWEDGGRFGTIAVF